MWETSGDVVAAVERAASDLAGAVAGTSLGWLALGVLLHLANQIARGRGWHAIVRSTCASDTSGLRGRDTIAAWVAGAGAGGVLSARGGDAVRVGLLARRTPEAGCPVLAGTLVAEAAGDALVGVAVVAIAVTVGLWPAAGAPDGATLVAVAAGAAALLGAGAALRRRSARVHRIAAGVGRGCAPLAHPGTYARRVLPWQAASRGLRAMALACFLVAFHLPATPAAVLLVMLAQSGGRLLPLAPASLGAAVAMLAAGFGPATGVSASTAVLAAFMIGMSTVLTLAGVVLAAALVALTAGPGALGAALRAARRSGRTRSAPAAPPRGSVFPT